MKEQKKSLNIYSFSHPLISTEILSLMGHKYSQSMSFKISLVDRLEESNVVLWDGIIGPKNNDVVTKVLESIGPRRLLMLLGSSTTLHKEKSLVRIFDNSDDFLSGGWSVLPEDLMMKFDECYKKLNYV